jgi:hypothetical protein
MSTEAFSRYVCWEEQPLNRVINTEAVSRDIEIFLATHAPFTTITYLKSPRQIKDTSETHLLEELLQRSKNDEHSFVVMQGIQGTGKSHLIRWLRERYIAESREADNTAVVLLIERANSSLRQTLSQIANSSLFDSKRFANQIKKLESATQQLSDESLSDTILNNLQIATQEVAVTAPRRIEGKVGKFLLDHFIRQQLKREGAAIERIRLFLSGRSGAGLAENEFPRFIAEDFDFATAVRRNIVSQGGHRDTKDLADTLHLKPEKRQELADYLNQLLPFTIERTTALSATDLKQMFYDLRRELKQQGKSLVLFIEDISVFTGLDAGLVDVLVTQHTGEGGRNYCRLTSVVGITDAYYKDNFPGNIKDRVTHHLTLNMGNGSLLLSNEEAAANLAARYLNALRLSSDEISEWVKFGAQPEDLPNACNTCLHRNSCHAAFGFSPLGGAENDQLQAGLYPFNNQALWALYQGLDTTKVSQTPRTFLTSILDYVLLSHTSKVKEGQFPPPARELVNDVRPPRLEQDTQRSLITQQTSSTAIADRIESLVLFWGDRTINRRSENEHVAVGHLSETVFRAFDLPFIPGDTSKPIIPPPVVPKPVSPPGPTIDPVIADIQEWRSGSELKNYDQLSRWLAAFAKESIDWEAHQISLTVVDDKITGRRFVIEGQRGRASGDRLLFERSDDLAFVLQALAALHQRAVSLSPDEIGGHLIRLSNWLVKEETRIVEFARHPSANVKEPKPLLDLLVETNLLIACLGEDLAASQSTPRELYLRMMKDSGKRSSWPTLRARTPYPRSKDWRNLVQGIKDGEAGCREQLQILVNCRQGISRQITFLDPAGVLDAISAVKKRGWSFPPLSLDENDQRTNKVWKLVGAVYNKLQPLFLPTVECEKQHAHIILDQLDSLLGSAIPKDVFQAIEDLLQKFKDHAISVSTSRFTVNEKLTGRKLANRLDGLQNVLKSESSEDLVLSLSGAGDLLQDALAYTDYFEKFVKVAREEGEKLKVSIARLERESQDNNQYQRTLEEYYALEQLLASTLEQEEV